MTKTRHVQIPEALFYDLAMYFTVNDSDDAQFQRCKEGLLQKYEAIERRSQYSRMHDASLSAAEREKARQDYLDRQGISHDFRWPEGGPDAPKT